MKASALLNESRKQAGQEILRTLPQSCVQVRALGSRPDAFLQDLDGVCTWRSSAVESKSGLRSCRNTWRS